LSVTNVPAGLGLHARLYPVSTPAAAPIALIETPTGYSGTFYLDEPAFEGYIHLWVEEPEPRREAVTDYSLGGNPAHMRGRWAPAISADGQVILFGRDLLFGQDDFLALQAATVLPAAPPWATAVGSGYRLLVSPDAPELPAASISFHYLGREVPPGEEQWLKLYYLAPNTTTWQILPTTVDAGHNFAAAPVQGAGLYALMSSIEIPLDAGWNSFAYPVEETRPLTETLLSIEGNYSSVYSYDGGNLTDSWSVYGVGAPAWVNDLNTFEFGQGYWISTTEAITLYLKGASGGYAGGLSEPDSPTGFPVPPATYYGPVSATAGMTVTVWVEGTLCGRAQTREIGGQVVYVLDVLTDDQVTGCGAPGSPVAFAVGAQGLIPTARWGNGRLWEWPLGLARRFCLSLVVKRGN
jgi:hypothetical protein